MTIDSTKQQNLFQLQKQLTTYKMIVPKKVEKKIRYLINKFPSTEWSGILFYKYTGNFDDGSLQITCEDIYPMDLGTSGWTEFKMTSDVASYIATDISLFDCEMGLVHSHHNMGAFFSGQDIKTLQLEGNDTNCFVSLIVDTKGTYKAAITRKVTECKTITFTDEKKVYEFFGEGAVENSIPPTESKYLSNTYIEYFMLDVEIESVENPLAYLDARFEEIKANKANMTKQMSSFPTFYMPQQIITPNSAKIEENYQIPIEFVESHDEDMYIKSSNTDVWYPDQKIIHKLLTQMLTCSLIIKECDLKQWVVKHMENRYKEIFKDDMQFELWADFIVEFIIDQYPITDVTDDSIYMEDYCTVIAASLLEEIEKYPSNIYMEKYKEILLRY